MKCYKVKRKLAHSYVSLCFYVGLHKKYEERKGQFHAAILKGSFAVYCAFKYPKMSLNVK